MVRFLKAGGAAAAHATAGGAAAGLGAGLPGERPGEAAGGTRGEARGFLFRFPCCFFKGNLSLLEIFLFFPGVLTK